MLERSGGVWRVVAGLAIAWAMTMLIPVSASAVDSDLKHAFAFTVPASNGYSVIALAANERADGRGEVVLFVHRKDEGAIYRAPAMLTATSVQADLGPLGKVDLKVTPSGKKKKFRSGCGGEPETVSFEPNYYSGFFGFYGEEGYTDAISEHPREYTKFLLGLVCAGGGGETTGASLPGARFRLHARRSDFRLDFQANQNHPGKPSRFEVEVHEKRAGVSITRWVSRWGGADAFRYDPLLKKATIAPPYPFGGVGTFDREAPPKERWAGFLEVDLPGRADQPLYGAGVRATLSHACRQWGKVTPLC